MGNCPCLAGAEKAIADAPKKPAPAPAASKTEEKKKLEPTTLPPTKQTTATQPVGASIPAVSAPAAEPVPAQETNLSYATFLPDSVAKKAEPQTETTPEAAPATEGVLADQMGIGSCLEVYSNSYTAWCPGVVFGIDSASILVAYQVPGEPADANISTKTLPIDSTELRAPTESGAWLTAAVEVYSHSNKAWCVGKVTEINSGVLSVVFFYPNEPPDAMPVMKQLPFGDNDLRLRGIDAAFNVPVVGVGHETLQVGSPVEVYSNSLGVWCPGLVQELLEGAAVIAFFYPDMDPNTEKPVTKELPLGHQDLRIPGYVNPAAIPDNTGPPVTEGDLTVGGKLEVYSQSRQVWILSDVAKIEDGMVTVQLRYPDMPPDSELYEKVLQIGGPDMRLPVG